MLPLKLRGHLLSSNVRSSMLHATETWPMSSEARHNCAGEISRVRSMSIDGRRGLGRPRKTWSECVKDDLAAFKLKPCDAQDRAGWRSSVENSQLEPTPQCGSAPLSAAVRPTRGVRTRSWRSSIK